MDNIPLSKLIFMDYSSVINGHPILCTVRGIYNGQFGLIKQSLTGVYGGAINGGADMGVRSIASPPCLCGL